METNKFAYLAGYIDGDGCFYVRNYIQKPDILVFDYSIQVCSVDKYIIQYFSEQYGGVFYKRPEKRENRKESFLWTIKTKQSVKIAEKIFQHLVSKKTTCSLFLSIGKSISPNSGISVPKCIINERQTIMNQIKDQIHMIDGVTEESFKSLKFIKPSIEPSEADFAYLAGLIDAEGCFRIGQFQSKRTGRSRTYVSILEIGNTKFPIFPWLMHRFGGTVVYRKPTSRNHTPMIIWCLKSKSLHKILTKIYPFLRVKKERCEKLFELHSLTISNGGNRKSDEFKIRIAQIQKKRVEIVEDLHKLNAKGVH